MNTPINDGGPAFPRTKSTGNLSNSTTEIVSVGGMSLRDWFAGQALVGLLTQPAEDEYGPKCFAEDAYEMADAMIEAREPKSTTIP